jgi:hypothetical protein
MSSPVIHFSQIQCDGEPSCWLQILQKGFKASNCTNIDEGGRLNLHLGRRHTTHSLQGRRAAPLRAGGRAAPLCCRVLPRRQQRHRQPPRIRCPSLQFVSLAASSGQRVWLEGGRNSRGLVLTGGGGSSPRPSSPTTRRGQRLTRRGALVTPIQRRPINHARCTSSRSCLKHNNFIS